MSENYHTFLKSTLDTALTKKVGKGLFWVISATIFAIVLNLISAVILARILLPSDFGLMAIIVAVISVTRGTFQTGFLSALIQKYKNVEEFLDTAWTLEIIKHSILFLIIFISAPFLSDYFNEPRATKILRIMSFFFILQGLNNIGTIYFRKNLQFHKQFVLDTLPLLTDILVAIPLAILLKSFWALVYGRLAMMTVACILSYIIHPYRPHLEFNLPKMKNLLNFGKWIFLSSLIVVLREHGVNLFVGKLFGISLLGLYDRATVFSMKLFLHINRIVWKVGYPAYSTLQNEKNKIAKAFLETLEVLSFIVMPMAAGMLVLGKDFVSLFLGSKWISMVPLIHFFSLHAILSAMSTPASITCQAMGKPSISTKFSLINFIILVLILYPLSKRWGITGTAAAFFFSNLLTVPFFCYVTAKLISCKFSELIHTLLMPVLNTIFMFFIIFVIRNHVYEQVGFADLFVIIIIALTTYLIVAFSFDRCFSIGAITTLKYRLLIMSKTSDKLD